MSFLNPAMLFGLLAAGVPIVIHLLNRRRYQRQRWAAMEWLLKAAKKNKRRLQMENLLLLLLRFLAVLFLALALTRPLLASGALPLTDGTGAHLYILLDNSASMQARAGTRTAFEDALTTATTLLGEIGDNDPVTVVLTNGVPGSPSASGRPVIPDGFRERRDHGAVRRLLGELRAAPARADLVASLKLIEDAVAENRMGRKKIAIISDLQAVTMTGTAGRDDTRTTEQIRTTLERLTEEGADVVLMPAGRAAANVAVLSVSPQDRRDIVQSSAAVFVVEVVNYGDRRERVEVSFLVDGQERGSQTSTWVELPPRPAGTTRPPSTSVEFEVIFSEGESGPHAVEASITADSMPLDDSRSYAFEVRQPIQVLAVDGDPDPRDDTQRAETHWLVPALALQDDGPIRVEVVNEREFARLSDLSGYDMVVLANVRQPAPSDESRRRLEGFVGAGGALVLTMGDQVVPDVWNGELYRKGESLLPAKLTRPVLSPDVPLRFDVGTPSTHPLLVNITDPDQVSFFDSPEINGRMDVESVEGQDTSRVLMTYTDLGRSAALVHKRYGRGEVLLVTTSVDEGWGLFPGSFLFPALLHETVYSMTARGNSARNLEAYEPYTRTFPPGQESFDLTLPDGSVEEPDTAGGDPTRPPNLTYLRTEQLGVYRWHYTYRSADQGVRPPPLTDLFAVNMTPLESDVQRVDPDELRTRWGDTVRIATTFDSVANAVRPERGQLHKPLLLAALLCLIGEVLIARRIGRRRNQTA